MSKQPNVIFVFSDQQRWDTCGCYGQELPVTPNLDRMAGEGVKFEMAFTCQPVCGPARAALQTGRWPSEVGCPSNHRMPPAEEMRLAPAFNAAGYETAYIGKWHLASFGEIGGPDDYRTASVPPERRGGYEYWLASDVLEFTSHSYDGHMFDGDGKKRMFTPGRYRPDMLTDWAIEYLQNRPQDRPLFMMISYIEPHHQNDHECYEGPHGSKEMWKEYTPPGDLGETGGDWRYNYPDYLGCCHALDSNVGRLRDTLEQLGMADDTVILYTSDHGSHFRTRNSEYKRSCHDGCLRIPMIAWGGEFTGGQSPDELVSLIDVPPTLLRAANIDLPDAFRGRPMQEVLAGGEPRQAVFAQISESRLGRAIRTPQWTYEISAPNAHPRAPKPDDDYYVEAYLYDNLADPHQKNNLVASPAHAEVRAELAGLIRQWMTTELGEPDPTIDPAGS
jgi:arylsulfatase A-like enzyme